MTAAPTAPPPPALAPPAISAPQPREISFGRVRGRVSSGTVRVIVRVDGVRQGDADISGRTFSRRLDLPARDVTIRVTAVDAVGNRASTTVAPVFGLPRASRPHGFVGSLDRRLQRRVRRLVRAFPGTAAVYVQDLGTGRGAAWNARARFSAASTVKLGIAIELLRVLGKRPRPASRLGELLHDMLVYSDNQAANDLEARLGGGSVDAGGARVTATLRALGLDDSYVSGGYIVGTSSLAPIPLQVDEQPSYSTGKYTSAWDLARIHRLLHGGAAGRGRLLDLPGRFTGADARFLLWTLAHVRDPGKLDRYLDRPRVSVLHKAGWISTARHDSGLVYWSGGAIVAVVMTYRSTGAGVSSDILAGKVARAALRRFSRARASSTAALTGRLFSSSA